MKIGVSTLASNGKNLINFLDFAEKLNIKYVEILNEYPNDKIDKDLLKSYSIKYTIHSPIADLNISTMNKSIKEATINEIKKSIDLAKELKSNIVVVHPGRIAFTNRFFKSEIINLAEESMKRCYEYGKEKGVAVAVENMPNMEGFIYQDPVKLNSFLKDNNMAMTLDIGHMNTYDPKLNSYFETVKHIHLSDNNSDFDHHYPLGEGSINFKEIIGKYEEHDYHGVYVIEVNDKESIIQSLDYLNKF
ncbi:sugar phosphate isomerase/epimerase family protein [Methanobrevibacter filiformis]|uniref:Endonuclease 4 n=1 Tax=Methanobrevibacter filiformis TaxID=55758 RepID=A0A166EFQ1_9EURY|nr:sugar phosphate isomerase/epimerase [Methanobrevibacter filiformis]KZX16600.1 endonuclease 4 [Methanobrevibacter filiformis]